MASYNNQSYGGGNPYGNTTVGGNPYGSQQTGGRTGGYDGYSTGNPYASNTAGTGATHLQQPPITHQNTNYSGHSTYSNNDPLPNGNGAGAVVAPSVGYTAPPTVLSNQDFLTRVEGTRRDIDQLSTNVSTIANLHQRSIASTDSSTSSALENQVSNTQILNTRIRDQIKFLEMDAARSGGAASKDSQIRSLKNMFKARLEQYQDEERQYRKRYQEQIARQYRIVNPEASEEEVREASTANWGDEGVFQTALRSNRTGAATSVLGSVRARHTEIQNIEKTLMELNQLFQDLAEAVVLQEPAVMATEEQTTNVVKDTEQANVQLTKGVASARRARKLKWICLAICVLVVLAIALALGLYFGLPKSTTGRT